MIGVKHITKALLNAIYGKGITPLPWFIVISIFTLLLFNAMTFTMVYAFLPKLIKSFGTPELDIGYRVGTIACVMFIGRSISSLLWGYIADLKGRKKTIIISACCMTIATLAFGFTDRFEIAICTRFLQGCSMGLVGISKAILSEHCDDSNIPLAMSIFVASFSTGLIIGPSIGGFLVFPGESYPHVFTEGSIFTRFNVLLPSVIVVAGFVVGIIMMLLFIPNDEKSTHCKLETDNDTETDCLIVDEINPGRNSQRNLKDSKLTYVLRNKYCIFLSVLYGFYSIIQVGYEEMFPLFAATSKRYNGLGFDPAEIGIALLTVAIFTLLAQFIVLPYILRNLGCKKLFFYATLFQCWLFPFIPITSLIKNRSLFWFMLVLVLLILRISICSSILSINVLINNSVETQYLATANGLAITLSTVGRAISPPILGSIFAWSLSNVHHNKQNFLYGFPFNQYFTFILLSMLALLVAMFVLLFPNSMNKKKQERKEEEI